MRMVLIQMKYMEQSKLGKCPKGEYFQFIPKGEYFQFIPKWEYFQFIPKGNDSIPRNWR